MSELWPVDVSEDEECETPAPEEDENRCVDDKFAYHPALSDLCGSLLWMCIVEVGSWELVRSSVRWPLFGYRKRRWNRKVGSKIFQLNDIHLKSN